jgi:RNA polymerase sigma-70 factor (ECF subfamily)
VPVPEGIQELLARARQGDAAAEERLFSLLRARILELAKRRVGNAEDAEDLTQETLGTILAKYRTEAPAERFLPWVFAILRNKIGNYWKRGRTARRILHDGDPERAWRTVGVSPEGEIRWRELRSALEEILPEASEPCRRVFQLLLQGADREEIRAAFGNEPMGTVDSRISRCRRWLLERLEETLGGWVRGESR